MLASWSFVLSPPISPSLNTRDGLYTTIIRGLNEQGEAVSDARLIRSVNREISAYADYDAFYVWRITPDAVCLFQYH